MHSPATDPDRSRALDWAVDAGFGVLLVVCAVRYFEYHPLVGTGYLVLALALGTGLSYAAAVLGTGASRPHLPSLTHAPQMSGGLRQRYGILLATLLWIPLTVIAPSFGWCAFALVFAVHRVLSTRWALITSTVIVVAVSLGLLIMSSGQDLGLVLGPFFGGLVLSYAYATLTRTVAAKRAVIAELTATRAQLARSEREAGALTERNRFASELHDTVVQRTASALLLLESAEQLGEGPAATAVVGDARDALRESLLETRRLVHGLADPATTGVTLPGALQAEAQARGAEFALVGAPRAVPEHIVSAVHRITREALLNVEKHAEASRAQVTVTFFPDALGVKISDDGRGFDPATSDPQRGFGLRAMAWRAEHLGGSFAISSSGGGAESTAPGTVVAVRVPLAASNDAPAAVPEPTPSRSPTISTPKDSPHDSHSAR